MVGSEYTVRVEAFEGPLDLLLFLIRRAEVEITDIPIAEITEQYLKYLEQFTGGEAGGRRVDIEQAGEFLVMAATLMEIKSRMLSPKPVPPVPDAGPARLGDFMPVDPRAELVRQLLEYKRFRDATDRLEDYRREWDHRFPTARVPRARPSVEEIVSEQSDAETPVEIEDLHLIDLLEAFSRIVESVDFNRVGAHRVVVDEIPVEVHGERIVERLRAAAVGSAGDTSGGGGGLSFASLFTERTRSEMIGMFLALLELVKQQRIIVEQDVIHGEIMLRMPAEVAGGAAAASPSGTPAPPGGA